MDSATIENPSLARPPQPPMNKTLAKKSFTFPWRAKSESHQDSEAQGLPESSIDGRQANRDEPRSPTDSLRFIKDFEKELRKRLEKNANRQLQQDLSKQKEWSDWVDEAFRYLRDKYTRQQHSDPESSSNSSMFEGSITYLAKTLPTSTNALGHEEDIVQCHTCKLALGDDHQTRDSLDKAQAEWDSIIESKFDDPSQLSMIRWIHIPANNEQFVKSIMPSVMATGQTARCKSLQQNAHWSGMVDRVFANEFWRNQRRVRQDNPILSRTMEPFADYINGLSKGHRTSSSTDTEASVSVLVAFMPYLHWERSIAATYMRHVIVDARKRGPAADSDPEVMQNRPEGVSASSSDKTMCRDEFLLRNYISGDSSDVHPRRTLDQFYYPTMEDTSERDGDQVIERYAFDGHFDQDTDYSTEPPILMVDQCWVWTIGSDTVLTAFPRTWDCGDGDEDPIDLHTTILKNIIEEDRHHRYLKSSCHFARFIIRVSAINLLQPSKQIREHHKFLLYFDHAIGVLRGEKIKTSKQLWRDLKEPNDSVKAEKIFEVRAEYRMLEEAKDIIEELQMIQELLRLQHETMRQFEQAQRKFLRNSDDIQNDELRHERLGNIFHRPGTRARVANVDRLYRKAGNLDVDINRHLSLKQQQASLIEGHYTRVLYEQGARQNESVMLFTVVTIIFLPLSTTAAIFGINSKNFGSGSMDLGTIFAIIFPISTVCVIVSLVVGLDKSVRDSLSRFLRTIFRYGDHRRRRPVAADDNNSAVGAPVRAMTTSSSSDISIFLSSDRQQQQQQRPRHSTRSREKKTDSNSMMMRRRLGTSSSFPAPTPTHATSSPSSPVLHRNSERSRPHRQHQQPRSFKPRKSHRAEGERQRRQQGDDVAMYSFSSASDSLNEYMSDPTGDEL